VGGGESSLILANFPPTLSLPRKGEGDSVQSLPVSDKDFFSQNTGLDIQIADFQGVVLDEFASGFHLVAHQGGKHIVRLDRIVDGNLQ
jgi:hypothetical protein